jgi:hypothetical protein
MKGRRRYVKEVNDIYIVPSFGVSVLKSEYLWQSHNIKCAQ